MSRRPEGKGLVPARRLHFRAAHQLNLMGVFWATAGFLLLCVMCVAGQIGNGAFPAAATTSGVIMDGCGGYLNDVSRPALPVLFPDTRTLLALGAPLCGARGAWARSARECRVPGRRGTIPANLPA